MAVKEYIGARYVPLIYGQWDSSVEYEPLTVVTNIGSSYTSRCKVPAGTDLSDETYWALTSDYNAQLAYYRAEVVALSEALEELEERVSALEGDDE